MFLFIFAVIVYFLFYRISSCLFFGDATDCFLCRRRTLLLLLKKPENPSSPHLIATGFDGGVILVILYSFLMLILCDQLFILITTVHRCFLFRKTYLATDLSAHALLSLLFICSCYSSCGMPASYALSTFLLRKELHHTVREGYTVKFSF